MEEKDEEGASSQNAGSEDKGAAESTSGQSNLAVQASFMEKLYQLFGMVGNQEDEPKPEQFLDEVSLEGIARYIQSDKCKKIVVMQGAGVSTPSGIPDFRSPETGLYHNLHKYNLPRPESIFDISYFRTNPEPFFTLAKELYPGNFKPTLTHYFIRLLAEKEYLSRTYTQNIDTLERIAGIPDELIVEAHGTFYTAHCLKCHTLYTQDWMKTEIFTHDRIPLCEYEDCFGVVKPDIVFFGESLPKKFFMHCREDLKNCDLLIVLGTSLVVHPFASLVDMVRDTTPRLLINKEKVGQREFSFMMSGLNFDGEDNYRDVAFLSDCDAGCSKLADLLGWKEELDDLMKKEQQEIELAASVEKRSSAAKNKDETMATKVDALTQKLAKSLEIDEIETELTSNDEEKKKK